MQNNLTEATIREYVSSTIFSRGEDYYSKGAVVDVVRRGDTLTAGVEGTALERYSVTVAFEENGDIETRCDCPFGGWCKHVVAVLLCFVRDPETVEQLLPVESLLAPLDRAALQTILLRLAHRMPELAEEIETEIEGLNSQPSQTAPAIITARPATKPAPLGVDTNLIVRKVRSVMTEVACGSVGGGDWDDQWDALPDLEEGIDSQMGVAKALVESDLPRDALPVLDAVTGALVDGWNLVENSIQEGEELFMDIGRIWAEAILSADLTREERQHWSRRLEELVKKGVSAGAKNGLSMAMCAADQAWDYPPLVQVMQGDFPDKGLWENKAPDWADELAIARIDVLERQGRTQEAAYLVEAEAHERRHGASLWRLGRIEKETLIAFRQVRTEESAMALAKQMIELGAIPYGLRMATDVLEFPGEPYQLAAWMRDKALAGGDVDWAIRATEAAINEIPNLDDYTQLQEIAGERWPEVRKRVLRRLRKVDDYISSEKVEILFREGLIPDALRMVDSIYEYDVAARVVDAATPTLPLEVIPICKRQAERIMDRAKADEYDRAVEWVAKARTAYGIAGKDDEWQAYKSHLLTTHSRKYKLVPMLREL